MRKMVFSLDPDAIGRLRVEPRSRTFPHSAAFPPVLYKLSTFELSASSSWNPFRLEIRLECTTMREGGSRPLRRRW